MIARRILSSVRMPVLGSVFAHLEPRSIMRAILQGGYLDKTKLPEEFVTDLLRSGRRKGYDKVSRGTFRRLEGFDRARERYPQVSAPITLVYTEDAWSRPAERDRVAQALGNVHRITVPGTGRFSALEPPHTMARILLDAASS